MRGVNIERFGDDASRRGDRDTIMSCFWGGGVCWLLHCPSPLYKPWNQAEARRDKDPKQSIMDQETHDDNLLALDPRYQLD